MNRCKKPVFRQSPVSRLLAVGMVLAPIEYAHAYLGPGLGVGTIMAILAFLGSLFLALFGIFWYPIKRALKNRRAAQAASVKTIEDSDPAAEQEATNS